MWKGAREQGVDYFDDILENNDKAGILEGGGLDDHDRVREKFTEEGVAVQMNCRMCGQGAVVTLEWMELFIVGTNGAGAPLLLPKGWQYSANNATCYCQIRCRGRCGGQGYVAPHVTPDEARRHVNAAVNRGMIPPQAIAQWKQGVDMARSQGRPFIG
jgi:hypothetical protein